MPDSNLTTSRLRKSKLAPQPQPTSAEEPKEEESQKSLIAGIAQRSSVWMISMILHVLLIVFLAVFTFAQVTKNDAVSLAVDIVSNDELEITTLDMPLEMEETDALEELPLPNMEESFAEVELVADVSVSGLLAKSTFGELSELDFSELGTGGEGEASTGDGPKPKFFKGGNKAATVVYIVDNSNSMTGNNPKSKGFGRMETALVELANSINNLDKSQNFYVVFYSDTAYGLFHPYTVPNYIPATSKNKQKVNAWLETVECCLRTNGSEAFELARKLKPELIYLLGDGVFGDKAHTKLLNNPIEGARIESFGMNLSGAQSKGFQDIAKAHGGKYRDVGITPEGLTVIKNFGPRKANNVRGPVWGVKLPLKRKKKN